MDRQQNPTSLHLTISPGHDDVADTFVADLRACAKEVLETNAQAEGASAMYGMLGKLPDRGLVRETLLDFMDGLDTMAEKAGEEGT